MEIVKTGNTITVLSGCVCIRGRFLEEDTYTTLNVGTDSAYYKLVIEIDLSKENTDSELIQAGYKILKGTNSYPVLTQTDIVANNSGIYQFELAQFRITNNEIVDLVDKRTYLDFDSIYEEIKTEYRGVLQELRAELEEVKDGSVFVLQEDFQKLKEKYITRVLYSNASGSNGTITLAETSANFDYIEIFYKDRYQQHENKKIYDADGKTVGLVGIGVFTDDNTKITDYRSVGINGTSITTKHFAVHNSWNNSITKTNSIYICKVVGYKY